MFFWRRPPPLPPGISDVLRKTKICATIGPSCESNQLLESMVLAGMNIARFNLSHTEAAVHKEIIGRLKSITDPYSATHPIGIALDTRGKEIRTVGRTTALELVEAEPIQLFSHHDFQHGGSSSSTSSPENPGNREIGIRYPNLQKILEPGMVIRMQDGEVAMKVERIENSGAISCSVLYDCTLDPDAKSVHLPSEARQDVSNILKPEDLGDLSLLAPFADGILLSFTESAEEIAFVKKKFPHLSLVAKIESSLGVENLEEIIDAADGVMVARGDLGMALPEALHSLQKFIIRECNTAGKPVWVATQMLESMKTSRKATVAELSDISNAVLDGADTLMLSAETARGDFPLDVVKTMSRTAFEAQRQMEMEGEKETSFKEGLGKESTNLERTESLSSTPGGMEEIVVRAAAQMANDVGARLILAVTESGMTARLLAKYRPIAPVLMLTDSFQTQRKFLQTRGVRPVVIENCGKLGQQLKSYYDQENRDEAEYLRANNQAIMDAFEIEGIRVAKQTGMIEEGDKVLLVRSMPFGYEQMLKVVKA